MELRGVPQKPSPLGGRWPRPRPRPDEGRACRYCPLTDSWFVGNGLDRSLLPCQKHDATGKPRAIRRDSMRCARPDVRMGQDPSLQTSRKQTFPHTPVCHTPPGRACPAPTAYFRCRPLAGAAFFIFTSILHVPLLSGAQIFCIIKTDFPAYARLPYTAGPGMPGPYRIFSLPPPRRGGFFHFYVNFTRSPLVRRTNILYN